MSTIKSSNEHLTLNADGSGKDIKFQSNGSEVASISDGGVVTATSYAGSGANLTNIPATDISGKLNLSGGTMTGQLNLNSNLDMGDNHYIAIGAGDDLQLWHDGTNSHIKNTAGTLFINSDGLTKLQDAGANETFAEFNDNSGVNLYFDNVKKFETTNEGAKVTGHLRLNNSQEMQFGGSATHIEGDSGYMAFDVGSTERMRITSNGSIHCPSTTASSGAKFGFGTDAPSGKVHVKYDGWNGSDGIEMQDMYGGNYATIAIDFQRNGSRVGTIQTTLSATQYNTSSDYRLKENVDYTWDATTRLKQLKPARFNFIADDTNTLVDGFIAHEVSSIVPEAISGAKDATETYTNDEGNEQTRIVAQGIDQSKLVPLLVKTIQELEARITALEA